jgi:hypothetical protein
VLLLASKNVLIVLVCPPALPSTVMLLQNGLPAALPLRWWMQIITIPSVDCMLCENTP